MTPQQSKGPQVTSTTIRRAALVAASAIAAAIAIACAGSDPAPADDAVAPAPPRTSSVAEQQEQAPQPDVQTTEHVADVSQGAEWPALPLTASEKASFCENLEAAAALSQVRRAQWSVGQSQHAVREALQNLIPGGHDFAASMLDLYYNTNPPINAIFLGLADLFETIAEANARGVEMYNRIEASDRQLASLVRRAWSAVTDYCRN